jgi:hypothetical protein
MHHDELPHEVIVAIQRVLELPSGQDADPLDALSNEFNPVEILNGFFPDGASRLLGRVPRFILALEASLAHIASVQARLIENQRELQQEINALQAELKQNQDPTRMHLIQEMISVRAHDA